MYKLTMNDGTVLDTRGAGETEYSLWIYGLALTIPQAAVIFSHPAKTKKMSVFYQQDLPVDVYEGYTELVLIQRDGAEGVKVCMKKGAVNNGED